MEYTSTRDATLRTGAAEAIVTGLAPGGGLFVPVDTGVLDFESMVGAEYVQTACSVLSHLLPQWEPEALKRSVEQSYGAQFGGKAGHLARLSDTLFSLELWHGPTLAFKDYALQLMPRLLVEAKRILGDGDKTLILVATSGDTGKAALEGYKDVAGTGIVVFYPSDGTSEIQKLQMATQQGDNVAVYAVEGNFDDAQRGVKQAFGDAKLAEELAGKGVRLSSANSINWGRLAPQIVYYATSYLGLVKDGTIQYGDPVDYYVPTGNFGDILAGFYARKMGLPLGRLVCASNQNNVLTDFLHTGVYDAKREFHKTSSPSMDILVSSNLERLLYHACGDDAMVRGWMTELAETGRYQVPPQVLESIQQVFAAGWADEAAVSSEIARIHKEYGYVCDPHTAVAFDVQRRMSAEGAARPSVVLSTASPYKFSGKVLSSLGRSVPDNEFEAVRALHEFSGLAVPESIRQLESAPVRFSETIPAAMIPQIPLRAGL